MNKKLLISNERLTNPVSGSNALYQVCTLYEDDRMAEITLLPAAKGDLMEDSVESILNNIYIARVQNVVANLSAAFVEIAKGQRCYLPLEDAKEPLFTKKVSKKPFAAGDELVVQVVKEAVKTKDAVVTTNLSFAGEYVVLTSANPVIGVSSRLQGTDRKRLQALAQELRGTDTYGIIIRTNAAGIAEEQIRAEFLQLKAEYEQLTATAATRTCYSCLRRERPFYQKMLLDIGQAKLDEVITDDCEIYEQLRQSFPAITDKLRLYEDRQLPLAKLYNIAGQTADALKQCVWLRSGANIVIQPTEALTVIDVNSGKNTVKKEKQYNHYKINLEAAAEIARQLRLRNISGIIIVDFIDLNEEAWNTSLLEAFRSYLLKDPVPVQLMGMTKLGLVELTRKKQKKPLAEQL